MFQKNKKQSIIKDNAWVVAAMLITSTIYWHGHLQLQVEKNFYFDKYTNLLQEKEELASAQKKLQRLLKNSDNPVWIEWILMQQLGLVPEGSTKVIRSPQ